MLTWTLSKAAESPVWSAFGFLSPYKSDGWQRCVPDYTAKEVMQSSTQFRLEAEATDVWMCHF